MRLNLRRRAAVAALALGVALTGALLLAVALESGRGSAHAAGMERMEGMTMASSAMTEAGYWSHVSGGAFHSDGVTRTYYIAADEVVWDYAPLGRSPANRSTRSQTRMSNRARAGSARSTSSVSTAATRTRASSTCRSGRRTSAISACSAR
jgi:hypothetical protein